MAEVYLRIGLHIALSIFSQYFSRRFILRNVQYVTPYARSVTV